MDDLARTTEPGAAGTGGSPGAAKAAQTLWLYRAALIAQALIFHRHVLFYPDRLFPWDFRAVHLPLATLISDAFRRGQWPLWDPFTYCGAPVFANIQAASFYPPVLAATAAASRLGDDFLPRLLAISVVVQIIFGGLCAFQLLRRLEAGLPAAWIGATVFELGCFFAAQAEHMGAIESAVWLPLIWLAVLELRSFSRKWLAILVAALAMTILGGLPQVAVAAFGSAICLALLSAASGSASWRSAGMVALACVWAIALAAIQFIPTAELTQNSVAKYRADWLGTGGGIPSSALLSLVVPNYWGVFDPSTFHGPTDLTFLYLYSSLLGLALAIGAMAWRPGKWERVFAAMLGIFTLAMLGDKTPVGRAALAALPAQLRIGIHPEFLFCAFSLALAVLAGLGAEKLLKSSRLRVAAGIVIACDLILVSSGRPMNEESSKTSPGVTRDAADGNQELVSQIREITNQAVPPDRFDAAPGVSYVWSSAGPIWGVPTGNGCDPMAPERTIQARLAFAKGFRWGGCYQVENAASPMLSLMNTRALVSRSAIDAPGLRLAAETSGYKIYENVNAMGRFFFVRRVEAVKDLASAAAKVHAADFSPSELAVVEAPAASFDIASDADRTVRVISYQPAAIRLETQTSAPAFLVATDSYYPGWQASVDGEPTQIYPTDAAFRGVSVPAGRHTVEFRFRPRTLFWSAGLSAAALAGLVGMCIL